MFTNNNNYFSVLVFLMVSVFWFSDGFCGGFDFKMGFVVVLFGLKVVSLSTKYFAQTLFFIFLFFSH